MNRAYRYCEWIAARHYENFPVASWLLPARLRPHVAAIYAFARAADDFADEKKYEGRSLELLGQWRTLLWACAPGRGPAVDPRLSPSLNQPQRMETRDLASAGLLPGAEHPVFLALSNTIREFELPVWLLDDLLTAFTLDVTKRRYDDWDDLLRYCRYSANPVGRLVLALFGIRDAGLERRSDCICTGLQLANHWQDLRIDLARDMIYIPQDLMRRYGVSETELMSYLKTAGECRRPSEVASSHPSGFVEGKERAWSEGDGVPRQEFRSLMAELVNRARRLFDEGEPLIRQLSGGLRLEIKLTVLGGRAILDRIEAAGYDVFRKRPALSAFDKSRLLMKAFLSTP